MRTENIAKNYIMVVGLPASGKSFWAADFIIRNPGFEFKVLSTDEIIEKRFFGWTRL